MSAPDTLTAQLRNVFGERLHMVVAFGGGQHICAVVDRITPEDLAACAALYAGWKKAGFEPPLLVAADELPRALDAFPLEFSEIISTRRLLAGADLLGALAVQDVDLRRACEVQARSHLIHLREAYMETGDDPRAVARLVSASAVPFHALLSNVARLDGTDVDSLVSRLDLVGFANGFSESLRAAERLVDYVDRWNAK